MSGAVNVSITGLLLLSVRMSVEMLPIVMLAGLKDLPSVGGLSTGVITGVTDKVATAGDTLLPLLVCNAPAGSELI